MEELACSVSHLHIIALIVGISPSPCPQGARQCPDPVLPLCHAGRLPGHHSAGEGRHLCLDHQFLCSYHHLRGCCQQRLDCLLQQHLWSEQLLPHEELTGSGLRLVSPSCAVPMRSCSWVFCGWVVLSLLHVEFHHMGFIFVKQLCLKGKLLKERHAWSYEPRLSFL